jgi:hypothetical protein
VCYWRNVTHHLRHGGALHSKASTRFPHLHLSHNHPPTTSISKYLCYKRDHLRWLLNQVFPSSPMSSFSTSSPLSALRTSDVSAKSIAGFSTSSQTTWHPSRSDSLLCRMSSYSRLSQIYEAKIRAVWRVQAIGSTHLLWTP